MSVVIGSDRHVLRVGDELASQCAGKDVLEDNMGFEVVFVTVTPHKPAPHPLRRRQPAAGRQVTNPPSTPVMNSSGCEPAERATRPRLSRYDLDLEPVDCINQHGDKAT